MSYTTLTLSIIFFGSAILVLSILPYIIKAIRYIFKKSNYSKLGQSSKIRLVHQLNEAVSELSGNKTGAIITIVNKQVLDSFRTDGVVIDANISSSLIISLFNKYSPLHDGAIIIMNNKITYAATYYKITNKSIDNKFGARHRAAMGISEQTDALTIVVSEETGGITITKHGEFYKVKPDEFQEKLTMHRKD